MRARLALLGVALFVAGCGSDIGEEFPVEVPPHGDVQPSGELTNLIGRYRIDARATEPQLARGAWSLVLGAGRYKIVQPSDAVLPGTYSVKGDVATFSGEPCAGEEGRYEVRRIDSGLTFATLSDCPNRAAILSTLRWEPRPPGSAPDAHTDAPPESVAAGGAWGFDAGADAPQLTSGHWRLEMKGGSYRVVRPDGKVADGTYMVDGDRVTFRKGPCPSGEGLYEWAMDGAVLHFTEISDDCASRAALLAGNAWDGTTD